MGPFIAHTFQENILFFCKFWVKHIRSTSHILVLLCKLMIYMCVLTFWHWWKWW